MWPGMWPGMWNVAHMRGVSVRYRMDKRGTAVSEHWKRAPYAGVNDLVPPSSIPGLQGEWSL